MPLLTPNEEDPLNKVADDRAPMPLLATDYQEKRHITALCRFIFSKHFGQAEARAVDDHIDHLWANRHVRDGKFNNADVKTEPHCDFPGNQQYLNCLLKAPFFQPSCTTTYNDIYCTPEANNITNSYNDNILRFQNNKHLEMTYK